MDWLDSHSGSVQAIATLVLTSPEAINLRVAGYYQQFLRRPADAMGQASFVSMIMQGFRDEQIIAILMGSPEYLGLLN